MKIGLVFHPKTMFSNAFFVDRLEPPLTLVRPKGTVHWTSTRAVARAIARWQTKAFVQSAMSTLGVQNPYQLERLLMKGDSELMFPEDRPHLFDRMEKLGSPSIARQLANLKGKHDQCQKWLEKLFTLHPSASRVLEEPIWRLLDPKPLSYVELCDLDEAFIKGASRDLNDSKSEVWGNEKPSMRNTFEGRGEASRVRLTSLMLTIRRCEVWPDLSIYYATLLEAVHTCRSIRPDPSLALFGPNCGDFLSECFGRIYIGYPDQPESHLKSLQFALVASFYAKYCYPEQDASSIEEYLHRRH